MADTTLKAYYAYLDELLTRRKYDEVVAHCQHILAKYPKNLGVLRRLAKAKLENGHYDEALALFGRVLTYAPQDIEAYVGLSWVSRQQSQGDNAIYYLERAYEREPNNTETVGLLREAYRVFHDRANAKLPNTPYMVARQQVRSGLSTQAVKTLRDALVEEPSRTDLQLLLTDIYAQIGQLMDAAKSAVTVLRDLPDCVRANQILATVWLEAGRPSDAQRLVSSIEDVDPHLAYEVAVGSPPPNDAFVLSMLVYQSGAGASTNITPNWMTDLSDLAPEPQVEVVPTVRPAPMPAPASIKEEEDGASWLDMLEPTADAPDFAAIPNDMSWLPDDDSASRGEALRNQTEQWLTSIDPTAEPPVADQNDWLSAAAPSPVPDADDNDDWLTQLGGSVAAEVPTEAAEPQDKWLSEIDDAFGASTVIQRHDFSRYLRDHEAAEAEANAAELAPSAETTGLTGLLSILSGGDDSRSDDAGFGASDTITPEPSVTDVAPVNSTAWMSESASEDEAELVSAENDPFAWMDQHDIEVIEPSTEVSDFLGDALGVEQMGSLEPAQDDALAWARSSGIDLDDNDTDGAVNYDDDPFAWMRQSGVEIVTGEMPLESPSSQPQILSETPDLAIIEHEAVSDDFGGVPQVDQEPEDSPAWSSGSGITGLLAFMDNDRPANDTGGAMGDNNDIPDWLKASSTDDKSEETSADGLADADGLDWLSDLQPEEVKAFDRQIEALTEDQDDSDESVPDWMATLEDARDPLELSNLSTVESVMIDADLTLDEAESGLFDSLTVDGTFADDAPSELEEAPAWVLADPPDRVAVRPAEPEAPMPSVTFNPQDDLLLVAPPVNNDPLTEEMDAVLGKTPDSSAQVAESDADAMEDWLSAMAANAPSSAVEDDPLAPPADDFSFDAEPAMVSDDLDFASLGFRLEGEDAPQSDVPVDSSTEFDWLDNSPLPAAANPAFDLSGTDDDDGMDWLSAAAPAASSAFDLDAADAPQDGVDWLADAAPEQSDTKILPKEDEFALSFFDNDPQMSTELGQTFFDDDSLSVRTSEAALFDFETEDRSPQPAMTGEMFSDIADDNDLFRAEESPIEFSETSAISAPDWLNALAPGLEVDTDSVDIGADGEYLGGGRGDYGWLNAIVEEESRPPVMQSKPRTVRFPFATPPQWLQTIREETQQISPVMDMDADDDGLPDWLNDLDDAEKN